MCKYASVILEAGDEFFIDATLQDVKLAEALALIGLVLVHSHQMVSDHSNAVENHTLVL